MYLLTIIVHHPLHLLGDFIVTGGDEWHLRYLEGMDGDGIIIDADICHTMPCINHGTDLRWDQFPSHQQLHSGTLLRAVGLYIPKLNTNKL